MTAPRPIAGRTARLAALLLVAILAACARAPLATTYVAGLTQPRGMALEPDGSLLIAEAGTLGDTPDDAPVAINRSGRVLRVTPGRNTEVLADGLPFIHDRAGGTDVGPADVALLGGERYLLTGEGHVPPARMLLRLTDAGPQPVADVQGFAMRGNTQAQMAGPAGVQANPFAMVPTPAGDAFLLSDGASGRVLRAALDGAITVFAEVPGMPPLTGMAYGPDGRLYVAVFSVLPHTPGTGAVWAADESGAIAPEITGLTMPIDVAFDTAGALYVLEFSDGRSPRDPYAPGGGRLLRIGPGGERRVLLRRLSYPTSMLFTPAGDLLIAVGGAFTPAGRGEVLRVACADLGGARCASR